MFVFRKDLSLGGHWLCCMAILGKSTSLLSFWLAITPPHAPLGLKLPHLFIVALISQTFAVKPLICRLCQPAGRVGSHRERDSGRHRRRDL